MNTFFLFLIESAQIRESDLFIFIKIYVDPVSEALFHLCRGTYISTLFGVSPTFWYRTTAFIIFFLFYVDS